MMETRDKRGPLIEGLETKKEPSQEGGTRDGRKSLPRWSEGWIGNQRPRTEEKKGGPSGAGRPLKIIYSQPIEKSRSKGSLGQKRAGKETGRPANGSRLTITVQTLSRRDSVGLKKREKLSVGLPQAQRADSRREKKTSRSEASKVSSRDEEKDVARKRKSDQFKALADLNGIISGENFATKTLFPRGKLSGIRGKVRVV